MTSQDVEEGSYAVVAPDGRRGGLPERSLSRRLGLLQGRRIGFVWDYIFRGDEMFSMLKPAVAVLAPDVTFIGPEPFGNIHGNATEEQQVVEDLPSVLRENRVDAVVVGVGA